jgi:hypothetical protein
VPFRKLLIVCEAYEIGSNVSHFWAVFWASGLLSVMTTKITIFIEDIVIKQ